MAAQSRRFAVLEVNGIAQNLVNLMEFVVDNNPPCGLKKLSRMGAIDLIHKMTITAVNWRLAHNPYGDYEEAIMAAIFGARSKKYSAEEKNIYNVLSNDPLWCGITNDVERQVSEHIEPDTWIEWKVIKVGNLIGLAEGQDYRISEYYRLHPEQREDDQAVITLDASNPVNYLLAQFNKEFGQKLQNLLQSDTQLLTTIRPQRQTPITHVDPFTQQRLNTIQRQNREMVKFNPEDLRQQLIDIYNNTDRYIAGMFVDTLTNMYPMVELAYNAPRFNASILHHLGVWNMDRFRADYLQKVISAFGLSYFTAYLKKDKKYVLEYSSNNILAIYEKPTAPQSDREDHELLRSFMAGDRLPEDQARKAQALYEELARTGEVV